MFCERVIELLKESERSHDTLSTYNRKILSPLETCLLEVVGLTMKSDDFLVNFYKDDLIRQILEEMNLLFKMNMDDANSTTDRDLWATVHVRHAALERNKRCLLAYVYSRLQKIRTMRWEFGSILPPDVRELISDEEHIWFTQYSTNLAAYMRSLGQDIGYNGIDLTENLKPPKTLYVEVVCTTDYGNLELEDGDVVLLKKNTRHFLPTSECQTLIRQGILKQINS